MEKWWWTWRNRILFIFTPVRRYRAASKAKAAAPLFRLIFLPGEVAALHLLMDRKTGTRQQHMASCFREHVVVNNYYSTTYRAFFPFRPIDESHAAARQRKSNQPSWPMCIPNSLSLISCTRWRKDSGKETSSPVHCKVGSLQNEKAAVLYTWPAGTPWASRPCTDRPHPFPQKYP